MGHALREVHPTRGVVLWLDSDAWLRDNHAEGAAGGGVGGGAGGVTIGGADGGGAAHGAADDADPVGGLVEEAVGRFRASGDCGWFPRDLPDTFHRGALNAGVWLWRRRPRCLRLLHRWWQV